MKIVIVGGGKVGYTLAAQLTKEQHDLVLIDNSREVTKRMSEALDMYVLYGNGAVMKVQREADVAQADLLIAVTPEDEVNLLCCVIAKKLGCKNTIARVRNPEYAEQIYFLRDELGLSMTVNPDWSASREIFRLMQIPGFLKRDSFAKGRAEIVEIVLGEGSVLCGVSLRDLTKKLKTRVLVCAVQRGKQVIIPDGSFTFEKGDKIHVTAPAAELMRLLRSLGMHNRKTKHAMLIGGGRAAEFLAFQLLNAGVRVKIIEQNKARCDWLAEHLPSASVINADGSNQELLLRENIEQMDTVVTLTGIDEENLIVSMYANYIGVPQVITKVNRTEYSEVFSSKGIDCVISPKLLCAENIVRYVRSKQQGGGNVLSVHQIVDGKVEALEFNVTEATRNRGHTLADLRLKQNILIACINRMGKIIIPGGNDTLEKGDTVVVVAAEDRTVYDLNDIFFEATE